MCFGDKVKYRVKLKLLYFLLLFGVMSACTGTGTDQAGVSSKIQQSPRQTVKNLILMIGDGMGPQQVGLLQEYARRAANSVYRDQGGLTAMAKFADAGYVGLASTSPADTLVTDSACSSSQLAAGVSSGNEMIGLDQFGNPVETILEKAKRMGKATGLVSDTRISHATPAAFASHQRHRSLENEVAEQMLTGGNVDVMLSGGLRHWLPQSVNTDAALQAEIGNLIDEPQMRLQSARRDERNLLQQAKDRGYELAFNREQLRRAQSDKVLGLFASSAMLNAITYQRQELPIEPSLADMTLKALEILSRDPDGFFLMVEGGQIDWAGHDNDAGLLLHEMLKFDEAIAAVYQWVKNRTDTLVVITADHETGGFGFSYSRYRLPEAKKLNSPLFAEHPYRPDFNFGSTDILDKLYNQKKSFGEIWQQARDGGAPPSVDSLVAAVNDNSDFKITPDQAREIIQLEVNEYRQPGHKFLDTEFFPKVHDFKEFYVYGDNIHRDLIGRQLGKAQNVVWATGTHTHTPVPVIAWGPESVSRQFSTMAHHTQVGNWMIQALIGVDETGSN